jgi:hypothetical protein
MMTLAVRDVEPKFASAMKPPLAEPLKASYVACSQVALLVI